MHFVYSGCVLLLMLCMTAHSGERALFDGSELLKAHAEALRVWNVQGGADLMLEAGGGTTITQYGSGNNDSNNLAWKDYRWGSTLGIAGRLLRYAIRRADADERDLLTRLLRRARHSHHPQRLGVAVTVFLNAVNVRRMMFRLRPDALSVAYPT